MKFIGWRESKSFFKRNLEEQKDFFGKENQVLVRGILIQEFQFDHEIGGKKFFSTMIRIPRRDSIEDTIPVIAEENFIKSIKYSLKKLYVQICGDIRTYKKINAKGNVITYLYIYAHNIELCENIAMNVVHLKGQIVKPLYFKTALCGNEIVAFIIRTERYSGKTDCLDCITWVDCSLYHNLKVGDKVDIFGKIQNELYYDSKRTLKKSNVQCDIWCVETNKR